MKQYDGIKDEELISRFKNGESEILDYLMEKYKNVVRKKARTMFLIGGENDDLIQEGMIGLFKAVRDYQPDRDAAFQTFAGICVDRQIYNAIQSSNRQKLMTGIEPVTPSLPRKCSTSEPHQHRVGLAAHIWICYQNLFVLSIPIF